MRLHKLDKMTGIFPQFGPAIPYATVGRAGFDVAVAQRTKKPARYQYEAGYYAGSIRSVQLRY